MVRFVHRFEALAHDVAGAPHVAFACAGRRSDGTWAAWLVFVPIMGGATVATDRETTQSSLEAVHYWAGGLGAVYLDGALARARAREITTGSARPR